MYERITVPLDGSKLAEVALPYAEELAARLGSYISLLTVLDSEDAREREKYQKYIKRIAEATRHHAEKYVGNGNGNREGIKVLTVTRTGDPAREIIEHASKVPFQLIIIATHGRSGINRWAVGSVADKVVRANINQPVLLIRAKESYSDMREKRILTKALVPLDGTKESEAVVSYIARMASKLQMELTLLQVVPKMNHAYADAEVYLQEMCDRLKGESVNAVYRVGIGSIADKIIDVADELAYDLVAMTTHGRPALNLWSLGSVAQKVFLGGNTPLLLVKQ
jgi:nucleotide-binding universal stress UspA family protein